MYHILFEHELLPSGQRCRVCLASKERHCKRFAQPLSLYHNVASNDLNVFFFNVSLGHVSDLLLDDFLPL